MRDGFLRVGRTLLAALCESLLQPLPAAFPVSFLVGLLLERLDLGRGKRADRREPARAGANPRGIPGLDPRELIEVFGWRVHHRSWFLYEYVAAATPEGDLAVLGELVGGRDDLALRLLDLAQPNRPGGFEILAKDLGRAL